MQNNIDYFIKLLIIGVTKLRPISISLTVYINCNIFNISLTLTNQHCQNDLAI